MLWSYSFCGHTSTYALPSSAFSLFCAHRGLADVFPIARWTSIIIYVVCVCLCMCLKCGHCTWHKPRLETLSYKPLADVIIAMGNWLMVRFWLWFLLVDGLLLIGLMSSHKAIGFWLEYFKCFIYKYRRRFFIIELQIVRNYELYCLIRTKWS